MAMTKICKLEQCFWRKMNVPHLSDRPIVEKGCIYKIIMVNISREQGNKSNFGGSERGNLENSSFSMHWPYAFVIVRRQSQCFDALLIFKRMLMNEN